MGLRANPTQRQRRLGQELSRLRQATGVSAAAAGAHAGLGRTHMGHIETGRTGISEDRLRALLRAYGVTSPSLISALVELAKPGERGWWLEYADDVGASGCDLAELEATAQAHRSFQWLYIPGLLQAPSYIRALLESGEREAASARIERYIEFRKRRKQILTVDSPPRFHAVIHEAVFHMNFVPRRVMSEQLNHLVEMSKLPHVKIQLLPFQASASWSVATGPFVLYDSPSTELRTVLAESPLHREFLSDPARISRFETVFEELSKVSLSPLDPADDSPHSSLRLIQHLRYVLEEPDHVGP
jgi:transcriptional regulator with XRE-family HTH domain